MQLTNLLTGVSGITALSPAMSAAGGRVIFSAYEEMATTSTHSTLKRRRPARARAAAARRGVLPPRTKAEGTVAATLQNPTASLPPVAELPEEEPYKPKFAGFCRAAVDRRRRRSVRHVCHRRRVVPVQRRPRQPRARDLGAGDQPVRRVRRRRDVPESREPLELGRRALPDPIRLAWLRHRRDRQYARRTGIPRPADRSIAEWGLHLSVHEGPASRSHRRRSSDRVQAGCHDTHLLPADRAAARRVARSDPGIREPEPGRSVRGARVRHLDLRCGQSDPGNALSPRGLAEHVR